MKDVGDGEASDKESAETGEMPVKRCEHLRMPLVSLQPISRSAKRAETRPCPICHESIPIRLLGKHSELEMTRVDEIIHQIGSTEVLADAEPDDGCVSSIICRLIRKANEQVA